MARRTKYYICAVINIQDKLFLVRPLSDDLTKTPFSFPGLKVKKNATHDKKLLKLAIENKYQGEIEVVAPIGHHSLTKGKQTIILRAYYCKLTRNLFLPKHEIDYRFAPLDKVLDYKLDDLDLLVAKQYLLFRQVFEGELVAEGRLLDEFNELSIYLDALLYFKNRVPRKLIYDFNDLIRSSASIKQLRLAILYIFGVYQLNFQEFIDETSKKKRRRKRR